MESITLLKGKMRYHGDVTQVPDWSNSTECMLMLGPREMEMHKPNTVK